MKKLLTLMALLALATLPIGCVVHGHGHGHGHGFYHHGGGHWHHLPGHFHGPGCGHVLRGGLWVTVP